MGVNNCNNTNVLSLLYRQLYSSKSQLYSNKEVAFFFRVIIEYREYRYMSALGDLNRTFNLFKDSSGERH